MSLRRYVARHLHRRIFVWFGASIILSGLIVGLLMALLRPAGPTWPEQIRRFRDFAGSRFERVWDDPAERDELAEALARDLGVHVVLEGAHGESLRTVGGDCGVRSFSIPVTREGERLGTAVVCPEEGSRWGGIRFALVLLACGVTLWGAAGHIARRITRPLGRLVKVTEEIGKGDLGARVRLGRHHAGEVGELADAINDMATRIEKQMADQRELLAAVSHEVRTPLARMRVLLEMARDGSDPSATADEIEREVLEIDALVGELLASARLDFAALTVRELDAAEVAGRELERADLSRDLLSVGAGDPTLTADPTLLSRALANLLDNAKRHGGGATRLSVEPEADHVCFAVEDAGAGFEPTVLARAFESFSRGESDGASGSLGLGLALVRRIAEAHGGSAKAQNLDRGARVEFRVRRQS